jgi:RNA polymerase sigma-70 factor (ECF subfamily)
MPACPEELCCVGLAYEDATDMSDMTDLTNWSGGRGAEDDLVGQLIRAAREGSEEALGQLTEACRTYLLLVANRELPTDIQGKVAPSDVVQDTFLEVCRDFPQFAGHSRHELLGWLRRILLNNVADAYRRYEQTGKRRASREVPLRDPDTQSRLGIDFALDTTSPSQAAIAHEEQADLNRALSSLPGHYREVLLLHHRDGLSFEEISRRVNRSAEAVRKMWLRAVKQLQQDLEGCGNGP